MGHSTIAVALAEPLQEYVETRVAQGEFGTPAEYVLQLIRQDRERQMSSLEDTLLNAMDSGESSIAREDMAPGRLIAAIKSSLAPQ